MPKVNDVDETEKHTPPTLPRVTPTASGCEKNIRVGLELGLGLPILN